MHSAVKKKKSHMSPPFIFQQNISYLSSFTHNFASKLSVMQEETRAQFQAGL